MGTQWDPCAPVERGRPRGRGSGPGRQRLPAGAFQGAGRGLSAARRQFLRYAEEPRGHQAMLD